MQERQRLHLVSAKRQDEIVQRLFQQMIAKKKRSDSNNIPAESTDPGYSHAKTPLPPVWAGSMSFCLSWTFMTLR